VTTFSEREVPPETQGESFSYYWGGASADIQKIALGDGVALPAGIAADQPGIEKLVRALRLVETLRATPSLDASGKATLASALDLVSGSIDQLGQLVGELGSRQVLVEDLSASHELMRLQLQDTVDGLENLDIGEAMTQLSSNQTQLQAAYMMLARLGSLSLLNFLK
jgi:flagellar hook-associated protein 3 FlgL